MFPLFTVTSTFAFSAIDRNNLSGPVRIAKSYELEFYTEDGDIAYLCDIAHPIRKGIMLLAKPGDRRYTVGNFSCLYVHFLCRAPEFASQYLDALPAVVSVRGSYHCKELLEKLSELFLGKSRTAELRIESILLELIAEFTDSAADPDTPPKRYRVYRDQINDTLDYMKDHYSEALSSALLAERIHLSVNFFQTVFRVLVGVPPARYLKQLRIESARQMLENTELSLSQIAELSGFTDASYLTYVFREAHGITPSEYRRRTKVIL